MERKLISIIIANLFAASTAAYAAEGVQVTGFASLGLRGVNDKAQDSSKFREYRDLDASGINAFGVAVESDSYHLNGYAENLGADDAYVDVRGGQYGRFKYQLYGNTLRHNFGSGVGARTPYSGVGSSSLTATFPSLNANTWNTYDNSYKREDFGGMFEWQTNSPWYFRTDANQVRRNGIKTIAASQGTSPGNGFVDLPSPVDWKTTNVALEGGYATKDRNFSINVMQSKFSNENQLLRWTNGYLGNTDTSYREPENELWKIGLNGVLKNLPMHSTFASRLTYSQLTSDAAIAGNALSSTTLSNAATGTTISTTLNQFNPTNPSSAVFNGKIVTTTFATSLTSNPLDKLDTRLYWNWNRKDNKSNEITFATGNTTAAGVTTNQGLSCGGLACSTELFNYRKNNLGLEAAYRLNPANRVLVGYDYYDTLRERFDSKNTRDNKYFIELKNSSLDMLTARLKYQYLNRRSSNDGFDPTNPIDQYVRRFDIADVNQHQIKAVFDIAPAPLLDIGLEAIYKQNDFKNTILGRTSDTRQEYFASIAYGDPKAFRVMLFGDVEFAEYGSYHRVGTGAADPNTPPTSTTYNWSSSVQDKSWQLGLGADWLPVERLKLNGSVSFMETNGSADFSRQSLGAVVPIRNYDNTRRTALNLRGTYRMDKQWSFTTGYAWEKYRFNDIGYQGFSYTIPGSTTAQTSYLSGQSAFQNYTANIVYLFATYRFQ